MWKVHPLSSFLFAKGKGSVCVKGRALLLISSCDCFLSHLISTESDVDQDDLSYLLVFYLN
jgi:hypothetical protein